GAEPMPGPRSDVHACSAGPPWVKHPAFGTPSPVRPPTPGGVTWITARHGPSDRPVVQGGALLTGASTTAGEGQAVANLTEGFRQEAHDDGRVVAMNVVLWIATGLLATVLLISTSKIFVPREKIAAAGAAAKWVLDFSPGALRAIGILEFLAVAGLILPAVLNIAPILVPVT